MKFCITLKSLFEGVASITGIQWELLAKQLIPQVSLSEHVIYILSQLFYFSSFLRYLAIHIFFLTQLVVLVVGGSIDD